MTGRHRRRTRGLIVAAAAALTVPAGAATAASSTWAGGGTGAWAEAADWAGGLVPGTAAAKAATSIDVARFATAGNGRTTVAVDANRSVGTVTFDTAATAAYTFTGGNLLPSGGVQMTATVVNGQTFADSLLLSTDVGAITLSNNASSAAAALTVTGAVTPIAPTGSVYQPTATLVLGGTNAGANRLAGPVGDATGLNQGYTVVNAYLGVTKTGTGSWDLAGAQTFRSVYAYTTVEAGTLTLSGTYNAAAGIINSGTLNVTGTIVKGVVYDNPGGAVTLGGAGHLTSSVGTNFSIQGTMAVDNTATAVSNRLAGTGVYLNGGSLSLTGSAAGGPAVTESIGTLSCPTGTNAVTLTPSPSAATVVNVATLAGPGTGTTPGTLLVTGTNLGATPGPGVTTLAVAAATVAPVGGGGGPGTTTASVLPFVVGRDLARTGNAQYGFVAGVGSANGLRVLAATEYATATAQANRNVSLTTTAYDGTANALRLDAGGGVADYGTVAVTSGAVLALPGNAGVGGLAFGAATGVVTTVGDLAVTYQLTGTAGLVKTGPGTLALGPSAAVKYAGPTTLDQGTLKVAATAQLPIGGVVTLAGGTLDLNGYNQYLTLGGIGLAAGAKSAVLNSNINGTVPTLYLLGVNGSGGSNPYVGTFGGPAGNGLGVNVQVGPNTILALANASTFAGPLTLASGQLRLDFSAVTSPVNDVLPHGGIVSLGDQLTTVAGAATSTQTLGATTVVPGATQVSQLFYGAGVVNLNLGALSHTVGGAVNLVSNRADNGGYLTTTANTTGIVGGWATFNGNDWATSAATGNGAAAAILPYAAYTPDAWSAGANVSVTTSATRANATANSLRFATVGAAVTLTLAGTDTVTSGGVLVGPNVGPYPVRLTGGTLVTGTREFTLNNWNPSGDLLVDSVLADNVGPTAVTVAGYRTVLSGANTYTGVTHVSGELDVSADANLGDPATAAAVNLDHGTLAATATFTLAADVAGTAGRRTLNVGPAGGTVAVAAGQVLTVPGPLAFNGVRNSTLTAAGPGRLVLAGGTSAVGQFNVSGGTLQVNGTYDLAGDTVRVASPSAALAFGPNVGRYSLGELTAGTVNLADTAGQPVTVLLSAPVTVGGGFSGPGSVSINGNLAAATLAGANTYTGTTDVQGTSLTFATAAAVPPPTAGRITVGGGSTLTFAATASGPAIAGNGTTTVAAGAILTVPQIAQPGVTNLGGLVIVGGGLTSTIGQLTGGGALTVGGTDAAHTDRLTLTAAARPTLSTVSTVTVNAGSTLDLTTNALDVTGGDLAGVTALAARGFASGAWTGAGLVSAAAAADADHLTGVGVVRLSAAATVDGSAVAAGDVLAVDTYYGDANLDGAVNAADYTRTDVGFVSRLTGWANGDFNYDGVIDGSDYALMDNAFNRQPGGPATAAPAALVSAVPEPAGLAVAGLVAVATVGRRGRSRR